jgi:hypothetical protein
MSPTTARPSTKAPPTPRPRLRTNGRLDAIAPKYSRSSASGSSSRNAAGRGRSELASELSCALSSWVRWTAPPLNAGAGTPVNVDAHATALTVDFAGSAASPINSTVALEDSPGFAEAPALSRVSGRGSSAVAVTAFTGPSATGRPSASALPSFTPTTVLLDIGSILSDGISNPTALSPQASSLPARR